MSREPEQMQLPLASPCAPVVRPLAVYRRAKSLLRTLAPPVVKFDLGAVVTDMALLEELRRKQRAEVRDVRRDARQHGKPARGGRALAQLAATTAGRKLHRVIDEVSARVSEGDRILCA